MRTVNVDEVIGRARVNRFHWFLIICCTFMIMCDGYDLFMYGTIVPSLMKDWGISPVVAGSLNSYALVGMMIGALALGPAADRWGRKNVIVISCAVFCVFTGLAGFAGGPTAFAVLRFIAGLGLGGIMPNTVALVTEYAPASVRSTLVAVMFSGHPFGGVVASLIGMWLVPTAGWQAVLWIGAIPLLVLPLFVWWVPDSLQFYSQKQRTDKLAAVLARVSGETYDAQDSYVLTRPVERGFPVIRLFGEGRGVSTVLFWVSFFMCLLTMYGLTTWLPKLMQTAGFAVASSLGSLLALNVGAIVGAVVGSRIADWVGAKPVLVVSFLIAAASLVAMSQRPSIGLLYVLLFVAGATTTGTQITSNAYVSQYYPTEMRSTGIGWALGVGRLGGILGPTVGGLLVAGHLSLTADFLAFALPSVVSAVAMALVQQRYAVWRQHSSHPAV
ncbi:MFS transporter [Alicyclobacillus kakegawensis]|uniref:MFS transporter n=1 Tax=Alicyclobacillus kakegawensis TaxID=392012 RepID=UPI00082E0AD1|nr:aromatic acid/H+ symport family MFS transporter [Alicyclobacillus kakegawensis]